jgi:hypothetical protein
MIDRQLAQRKRTNFIGNLRTNNIAKPKADNSPHAVSDYCPLTKERAAGHLVPQSGTALRCSAAGNGIIY